jgi:large subunit ribosomal protein L31e
MAEEKKIETKVEEKKETKVETPKEEKKIETKKEEKKEEKTEDKKTSTPAVKKETKKSEKKEKVAIEREYIIPIRKYILTVPRYKRAKKAISVIRKFIVRHMNIRDGDERKVKIDKYLNNEVWFRGIKKPAHKIKVKAKKIGEEVFVELAEIPEAVKFVMKRDEKRSKEASKVKTDIAKSEEKQEENEEEKQEVKEKEKASAEAGLERQEKAAKAQKHTAEGKHQKITAPRRKALKK